MCELYAMSSSKPASIHIALSEFRRHGGDTGEHADGWGLAFVDQQEVDVYREPAPASQSSTMDEIIRHHKPSSVVMSHIRKATQGAISLENTQPFTMSLAGRSHIFIHNGNLNHVGTKVPLSWYKTRGETDSEVAFGYLMEKVKPLWAQGKPTLEQRLPVIELAFILLDSLGIANFIYFDSEYLYAFANERKQTDGRISPPGLWYLQRTWTSIDHWTISGLSMSGQNQQQLLIASVPLTSEEWLPVARNQLIVAKDGMLVHA